MFLGILLLVGGLLLIVWGADWFTDGAIRTAAVTAISPFYVGIIVSGLEPENLVTGLTAAIQGYPQIALGTIIGSAIFLLTGALGIALLFVPMEIRIPQAGGGAMLLSAGTFALTIWDADVTRLEGAVLLAVAIGLLVWLHGSSPVFLKAEAEDEDGETADTSRGRAFGLLLPLCHL